MSLHCGGTKVSDLSPLDGMPLTHLNCSGTKVSDASLAQIKNCKDLNLLSPERHASERSGAGPHQGPQEPEAARSSVRTKVSDSVAAEGHGARGDPPDPQEHHHPGPGCPPQHEEPQDASAPTGTRPGRRRSSGLATRRGSSRSSAVDGRDRACAAATIQLYGSMSRRLRASIDSRAGRPGSAARPSFRERRSRKWSTDRRGTIARTLGEETRDRHPSLRRI